MMTNTGMNAKGNIYSLLTVSGRKKIDDSVTYKEQFDISSRARHVY